jgi:hypothetical protein
VELSSIVQNQTHKLQPFGITASQLVAELLELGPQDACVIFGRIADRLPVCRLSNGTQLSDAINCSQFFDELAAVTARGRILRSLPPESYESWEASQPLLLL